MLLQLVKALILLLNLTHELSHLGTAFRLRVLSILRARFYGLQRMVEHADEVVILGVTLSAFEFATRISR